LIRSGQKEAGILHRYYLQLHAAAEDAVDEAETGLKSALAVKIFGSDLQVLDDRAARVKSILRRFPGSRKSPWSGAGPAA
jgi:Cu/Ag efflux pump CusA